MIIVASLFNINKFMHIYIYILSLYGLMALMLKKYKEEFRNLHHTLEQLSSGAGAIKHITKLLSVVTFIIFSTTQVYAECIVNSVSYDVGGRTGSGVTAIDRTNKYIKK